MSELILASTSVYRRELLSRLRLPFSVESPQVDERPQPHETPARLAERLALEKAWAVARRHPAAWVIGADQVADLAGRPLGKPGDHAAAVAQLRAQSGREVQFYTAVAVVRAQVGFARSALTTVGVRFRTLDEAAIQTYLRLDRPYDCAGSAKCETLGIALLERVVSDDPTALVGLPLIATTQLLCAAGLDPLAALAEAGGVA
ncbi:MAG TPA: Maf family nucleotide pyrophosphatase [Burkholderiaceae bacterium]|nr:Maf family nucleotide pyrophosphatase [Burkholderiaceae bacterium]HMX11650.1 Maf family nucleotide pyrophosphatase [Burkholderiaceae bacterium]HMY98539.1 Maf family nucleotide pyrophosphatase [Burkholderiaceae bacterium]HNB43417.1 Maf family nucleotide pyrophosphatase [Burkholderiaceae bacterium]HNG78053.1 Maf family nucleotide pyrophosphatase [Burkholderiaceae bacterium]